MKNFIQRVQDLSQKATQLKQVVEAAPTQAAQLRDTVLMTAGQLQQMRRDVQSSVMGLKADNETHLTRALQEIHDNRETFSKVGYALTGVDMDLSPINRLVVHLDRVSEVSESTLRSLLSAHSGQPTMRLPDLSYRGLVVHVGPTPSVRLSWQTDEVKDATAPIPSAPVIAPSVAAPAPPPLPAFGASSFFEQRSAPAARSPVETTTAPAPVAPTPVESPDSPSPVEQPTGGSWKPSALDRFKKMPDVSKYRR
jgi:hypothetical protein